MQQAGQVPHLDQNDAHEQSLGQSDGSLPGPKQTLNQSKQIQIFFKLKQNRRHKVVTFNNTNSRRQYLFKKTKYKKTFTKTTNPGLRLHSTSTIPFTARLQPIANIGMYTYLSTGKYVNIPNKT